MSAPHEPGPGGLFDGLDDPAPPAFGADRLPGVLQRGQQLRHQRRMAYTVGSACTAVLVAGTAAGVAATGGHGHARVITPASPSASASHTKQPRHHSHSPAATVTGRAAPGHRKHESKPPPCATPTPEASETPTPTPTPSDSVVPTPSASESLVADTQAAPPADPVAIDCPSPPVTAPTTEPPTQSTTPDYPTLPPLLDGTPAEPEQPSGGMRAGSS